MRLDYFFYIHKSAFFTKQLCIHTYINANRIGVLQIVQLDTIKGIWKQSLAALNVISLIDNYIIPETGHTQTLLPASRQLNNTWYWLQTFTIFILQKYVQADTERHVQDCKMSVHKWKAEDGSSVISFWIWGNGCSLYICLRLYLEYWIGIILKKVIVLFKHQGQLK